VALHPTENMGGLWEAAVRSMKRIMRKILPSHLLKVDELSSILTEIEAALNSRPLVQLEATDPDTPALTPGHFLVGRPLLAQPTPSKKHEKISSLRRWNLVQRLNQDFWEQWKTAYVQTLQQRTKWQGRTKTFQIGDVVFLREDIFSYRQWPLARIIELMPGDDGIVRAVKLRCKGKEYERAVVHLIPFLSDEATEEDDATSIPPVAPPPQSVQVLRRESTEHGNN